MYKIYSLTIYVAPGVTTRTPTLPHLFRFRCVYNEVLRDTLFNSKHHIATVNT